MLKYQYILVDKIDYPSVIFESDLGKINHQTFCLKFSKSSVNQMAIFFFSWKYRIMEIILSFLAKK